MRLALLSCLALVAALNRPMWCVPGECKIDSNCRDEIHGVNGRCCGGKCVHPRTLDDRKRLIGERCAPDDILHPDNYEQCFAECSGGLFCNTVDETCHAKRGANCPCLADRECFTERCRTSHVCEGKNLPFGETCERNGECASGVCANSTCSARAIGELCTPGTTPCVPGAICRYNSSGFFCLSRCAVGEASCCFDGKFSCATTPANLQCNLTDFSCYVPVYPGLDEPCDYDLGCNNSLRTCALSCNATGCESPPVCQLRNQVEVGLECDEDASGQCVAGSVCTPVNIGGTWSNMCVEPTLMPTRAPTSAPTSAPTGSPTPRALNSVPLGQPCGDSALNYDLCQAPGNMCELNQTGYYVCKQSGTTPIGAFCSISSTSLDVRALDECVQGSRCTKNDTDYFAPYHCLPRIPTGQRCYASPEENGYYGYRDYSHPECENGWDSCAITGRNCYGYCSNTASNGDPCCTCIVPRSVPNGKNCSVTRECQQVTSVCFRENNTCGNIQGADCITPDDCRDGSFDCSCDRKCYFLNAPTSSRATVAPTASTRAPSPNPPQQCQAQQKAWAQMLQNVSFTSWIGFPSWLTYATFHDVFVPQLLELTEDNQATAIAYVCCSSCGSNERFNSHIYKGYQVDCGAKKLIKLEDTCNDLRGNLAMANCWGPVSAASTFNVGLGFVLATFLIASL